MRFRSCPGRRSPFELVFAVLTLCWLGGAALGAPDQSTQPEGPRPYPPPAMNTTSVPVLRSLADSGDVKAQSQLGNIYLVGSGVKKDYAEAVVYSGQRPTEAIR